MRSVRSVAHTLAAITTAALTVLATAAVAQAAPVASGTEPVHDYAQAIREQVWVQTGVDSDADGRPDRVAVRIIRPRTDAKVPVIFQASPYYAGLNDVPNHDDIDRGTAAARRAAEP